MKNMIIAALLIGLTISSTAFAYGQYAFWTGRSERVTTMNYQQMLNCEYKISDGRTFWRAFAGYCPAQVEVN
jgi:ABC-type uncharacterized transport system permease subunit